METDMTRIRFQHEKYGKVQGIMSLVNEAPGPVSSATQGLWAL